MESDDEGFLYPIVDNTICINCGLCEKVCPVIHPFDSKKDDPIPFACKSLNDDLVERSSSGGLFSIIAHHILSDKGVVFGAAFDSSWGVHHIFVESYDSIGPLRESKYVQSDLGNCFSDIKDFINSGRKVLFTGTPCQVAGLNHFLDKNPNKSNLTTIDIICHSCPSPLVWKDYLSLIEKKSGNNRISSITFRDKEYKGWKQYSLRISVVDGDYCRDGINKEKVVLKQTSQTNLYMQGFLNDLYCRPSCANCPARNYKSGSDITLGDCWAVDKYYDNVDDDKGLSVALLNTEKGIDLFESIKDQLFSFKMKYEEVEPGALHAPLTMNTGPHPFRKLFFRMKDIIPLEFLIYTCLTPVKIWNNTVSLSKRSIRRILGVNSYDYIKRKIRKQ
jgi:coenzyme F420-reducing hydrogenase beta subunit